VKKKQFRAPFPRTRKQLVSTRLRAAGSWGWNIDNVLQSPGSTPAVVTNTVVETQDVVTPGFAQRIAAGEIISNPYSMARRALSGGGGGDFRVRWTGSGHTHEFFVNGFAFADSVGNWGSDATPELPNYSKLISYNQTRALSGVQAATLQTGVVIGEFCKTMQLLVSPVRALQKAFAKAEANFHREINRLGARAAKVAHLRSALRKRKAYAMMRARENRKHRDLIQRIADYAPSLADAVLTANLGIKPLLMDLEALLEKIPKLEYVERRVARSSGSLEDARSSSYSRLWSYNTHKYHIDSKSRVTVRCSCIYEDGFETSQHFGSRISDLPETVWNIIPLSFLVDYVLNVNDYLGALRAQAYSRILTYNTVVHIESSATKTWDSITPSTYYISGLPVTNGTVLSWNPGPPETLEYEMRSRRVDSFGPSFVFDRAGTLHPPAQLQNVLALSTRWLTAKRSAFK